MCSCRVVVMFVVCGNAVGPGIVVVFVVCCQVLVVVFVCTQFGFCLCLSYSSCCSRSLLNTRTGLADIEACLDWCNHEGASHNCVC